MAACVVPVDLTNPGQVFACLGLAEAADSLLGAAQGTFDWRHRDLVLFRLKAGGDEDPARHVLRFLEEATVTSIAPRGSVATTEKWSIPTQLSESCGFPFPDPEQPAKFPARLTDKRGRTIDIDHWGDATRSRDNVKFWAGSGGYPGAALARDALDLVRGRIEDHVLNPFSLAAPQKSSFRLDWRRDYVPIDQGFSNNLHANMVMQGYPLVELLAAIGLTNARPLRHTKLSYNYGVPGQLGANLYELNFLRLALGAKQRPFPGMPFRKFHMQLDWPGQKNQARCIISVIEENIQS